jgi:hypothetical protein
MSDNQDEQTLAVSVLRLLPHFFTNVLKLVLPNFAQFNPD